MGKISTYPLDGNPKLSDKLIGTSVGTGPVGIKDPTYNFSLQQLLDLFSPLLPGNTLQGVLDNDNTATQDINLFGRITTTELEVTDISNLFSAYISDSLYVEGQLFDKNNFKGTSGQILISTGDGVQWFTPVDTIPTLQEVLMAGNEGDVNIILTADIFAEGVNANTALIQDSFQLNGSFIDSNGMTGTSGQMLTSLGAAGVLWQNVPLYTASSPLFINPATRNITIQQANGTQNGYLSFADWINFDGKQNALSGTGIVFSNGGTITYITNNSSNWNQAYNDSIVSASVTGTTTKTLTLTQRDGDVITTTWTESGGGGGGLSSVGLSMPSAFVVSNSPLTANGTIQVQAAGTALQYIKGDGTLGTLPSVAGFVPYTGATQDVDLGSNDITANAIIKSGGTSSQFLKADGSIDSNSYITLASLLATSPLIYNNLTGTFSIQQSSAVQGGFLSAADWITFNNKQNSGNYITGLTGEASASGPGVASIVLNNAAVIAKVLTGLNVTGGSIVSTDTILQAFGKLQNQINGLIGGSTYQGTWNAATNTPTLTSGVGTDGYYYIVNVAGNTNLNGITDWNVGDWAIFHGGTWQKVDNTDAVVSVNGYTGAVNLVTSDIPEGLTNLYFTDARARLALSFAAGSGAYNNLTGVITIPTNNNQILNGAGYITNAALAPYLLSSVAASTYYPIPTGTTSQYVRGDGSLATFPSVASEAQRLVTEVYNNTGSTLTKGTIVYIVGGQGNLPTVAKALANSDATSAQTYGVVQSDITNNNNGYVVVIGSLTNLDTQAYPNGTQLYLSGTTAGTWTSVKPQSPIHLVYIGVVVRSHPTQGVVEIKIQNGYELDELHDVYINSATLANGDILQYNSSNDLWENKSLSAAGIQTSINLTTNGNSGPATFNGVTLNIPEYQDTTYTFSSPLQLQPGNNVAITQAGSLQDGYLSSIDWNTFNNKAGVSFLGANDIPMGSVTGELLPSGAYISGTMFIYRQNGSSVAFPLGNFNSDDNGFIIGVYNGNSASLVIKNWDGSFGNYEAIEFASIGTAISYGNATMEWRIANGITFNPAMATFNVFGFEINANTELVTYSGRQLFQDYTSAPISSGRVVPMVGTLGLVSSGIEVASFPVGRVMYFYTGNSNIPSGVPNLFLDYQRIEINAYNSSGNMLALSNYFPSNDVNVTAFGSYILSGYEFATATYKYASNYITYNQLTQQFKITYFGGDVFVADWNSQTGSLFGKQIPVLNNYFLHGGDIPYVTLNGQLNASGLSYIDNNGGELAYYGGSGILPSAAYTFKSTYNGFEINNVAYGSGYQLTLNNYAYPSTGIMGVGGPMIYNDAVMGLWTLMNGGIVYYDIGLPSMTFNAGLGQAVLNRYSLSINSSNIWSSTGQNYISVNSNYLPDNSPIVNATAITMLGVFDFSDSQYNPSYYAQRNIYVQAYTNSVVLTLGNKNSCVDFTLNIKTTSDKYFTINGYVSVYWEDSLYTFKVTSNNTSSKDDNETKNINMDFEFVGGQFLIKLDNSDGGNDVFVSINANIS